MGTIAKGSPAVSPMLQEYHNLLRKADHEMHRVIFGMHEPIQTLFLGILSHHGGNVLAQGVPGIAKTTLMRTFSAVCELSRGEIRCNVGLTPDDVIGAYLRADDKESREKRGGLKFYPGQIFSQSVLVDELNRLSPKTQSVALQALEERKVTTPMFGEVRHLPKPFCVLGTQNPNERSEGTFNLNDALIDRFRYLINVGYESKEAERGMLANHDSEPELDELEPVLSAKMLLDMQGAIAAVFPSEPDDRTGDFVVDLCRASRPENNERPKAAETLTLTTREGRKITMPYQEVVKIGASPRTIKHLWGAARALAFLEGQSVLTPVHVKKVAHRVLRHRMFITPHAAHDGFTSDIVISHLLDHVSDGGGSRE